MPEYPSLYTKLPEPGRLQDSEWTDFFRSLDGCPFYCGDCGE